MIKRDRSTESIALSKAWYEFFQRNNETAWDLPWDETYRLTLFERQAIEKSVQQFQLGERAEGRRLLARGRAYSRAVRDPLFPEALMLFIKEEQRHSAQLLRFMQLQRIRAVGKHWVDSVFRWVRVLAGLELELRVLVTAEVIAVPYYRALGCATGSALLRSVSARILQDEAEHLRFQASMLARLEATRSRLVRRLVWSAHRWFVLGTCCVVWSEHRDVFRVAGRSFRKLLDDALAEFAGLEAAAGSNIRAWPRNRSVLGDDSDTLEFGSASGRSDEAHSSAEAPASQLP